jgi:hypothetical protein
MDSKQTLKARLDVLANIDALVEQVMVLFPRPNEDSVSQAACARISCETATLRETSLARARDGKV